jgi:O-antigen/teichoic acid export membrane protein
LGELADRPARAARDKTLRGRLASGGIGSIGIQAASLGLGFVLTITLARALGTDGYGVYAYVFAMISVVSVPAKFGLPVLLIREVARANVDGAWGTMRGVIRWSNFIAGTFSVVLAAIVGAVVWTLADRFESRQIATFSWALLLVPPMVLGELRGAALRGLGRVFQGQLPERILRPGFLVLFCCTFLALHPTGQLAPDAAMAMHVAAATCAFLIGAAMFMRVRPPEIAGVKPVYAGCTWLAAAWPLALAAGMQVLSSHTDILMLGIFAPASEVGVYRAASQLAGLVSISLVAVNQVVAPQFAALHASGEMGRLQQLATSSSRLILAMAAVPGIVLIVFGGPIMILLFGADYSGGRWPLTLLVLGQLANASFGSVAMLLNMSGHERKTARGVVIAEIFNVVINLVLIPSFGGVGAAAATAMTVSLWNAILWLEVRRNLGIRSGAVSI